MNSRWDSKLTDDMAMVELENYLKVRFFFLYSFVETSGAVNFRLGALGVPTFSSIFFYLYFWNFERVWILHVLIKILKWNSEFDMNYFSEFKFSWLFSWFLFFDWLKRSIVLSSPAGRTGSTGWFPGGLDRK